MIHSDSWISALALADSTSEILTYEKHSDPNSILKEESLNLLSDLNILFFKYAEIFNQNIKPESTPLKVMGITNKQSFLIFRKNYRLVISIYEPGVILFTFDNFSGNLFSQNNERNEPLSPDEVYNSGNILVGHLGPFNETKWLFEDHPIDIKKVVRHYFTEFIKASTDLMRNAPLTSISPIRKNVDAT